MRTYSNVTLLTILKGAFQIIWTIHPRKAAPAGEGSCFYSPFCFTKTSIILIRTIKMTELHHSWIQDCFLLLFHYEFWNIVSLHQTLFSYRFSFWAIYGYSRTRLSMIILIERIMWKEHNEFIWFVIQPSLRIVIPFSYPMPYLYSSSLHTLSSL